MEELHRPPAAVGIAGLGAMGGQIARHLVDAGYRVLAYDVSAEAVERAAGHGAEQVAAVAELARCGVVVTSLPSAAALDAVTAELAAVPGPLRHVLEVSTLSVEEKDRAGRTLGERGVVLLDCPLSGTGAQMVHKDVVVYASGDARALEVCGPVLSAFSRQVFSAGAFGNGTRLKLVANLLVAVHNVAAGEALALAARCGLDPAAVLPALLAGAGASRMLEVRGPMMVAREYLPPTMRVELFEKDVRLIGDLASASGARVPLLDAAAPIYRESGERGHGAEDTASVIEVLLRP